jgi:hypothetical protein
LHRPLPLPLRAGGVEVGIKLHDSNATLHDLLFVSVDAGVSADPLHFTAGPSYATTDSVPLNLLEGTFHSRHACRMGSGAVR